MSKQFICSVLVLTVSATLAPKLANAQASNSSDQPRTSWGTPDLQGIWDFRSITPLQRPEALVNQEFLT